MAYADAIRQSVTGPLSTILSSTPNDHFGQPCAFYTCSSCGNLPPPRMCSEASTISMLDIYRFYTPPTPEPLQHLIYCRVFTSSLRVIPQPLQGSTPMYAQLTVATSSHSSCGVLLESAAATALARFLAVSPTGVLVNSPPPLPWS